MKIGKKTKGPAGDGTAVWIDEVGAISTRVFKVIDASDKDKVVISFGPNERYKISKRNIRIKRIIIYKLPNGNISCQNPDKWGELDLKAQGIKELRFNLQNFSLQEGKAAIYRWNNPKTMMDKLMPLFRLMFICIVVGVIGWAALKMGTYVLDMVVKSRVMDCRSLIQSIPSPIGAINATVPIGA